MERRCARLFAVGELYVDMYGAGVAVSDSEYKYRGCAILYDGRVLYILRVERQFVYTVISLSWIGNLTTGYIGVPIGNSHYITNSSFIQTYI